MLLSHIPPSENCHLIAKHFEFKDVNFITVFVQIGIGPVKIPFNLCALFAQRKFGHKFETANINTKASPNGTAGADIFTT